ncbi:endolytic transglycosylase MltG [Mycetocola sp.]|uniref:endolytic transglycosylase MltG n=1 Tax=Mycetocola sp. TaxID=1871042 RepID=UPI0026343671|nr:endolytic transglycosylase MltG [Mycetocola sp.]MCU1559821.1 mltG [Mycetocola sp.]
MTEQTPRDDAFDAIFGSDDDGANAPAAQEPATAAAPMSRREAREQAERARADASPEPSAQTDPDAPEQPAETSAVDRSARRAVAASDYPPREKRRKTGWIAALVVLVLIGGIGGGGLYVWNTFEPQIRKVMNWQEPIDYEGSGSGEATVWISAGDTGIDIARTLKNRGVTKTTDAFYELLLTRSSEPVFHPGVYKLAKKMSAQSALDALLDPANKIERTVLLREGITGAEILAELSAGTEIPLEELQAAVADPTVYGIPATAPSIEGWLFPALYTFDPDLSAQDVIKVLVDRTITSLDKAAVPVDDRERILTIASIIQREARLDDDFYKVSRVITNRLAANMKLEMDSTAQYGENAEPGTVWSTKEALESDNPWNTYVHTGLPIGPIASPGDTAIAAAMAPAEGTWLFFVTVNLETGETVFTNTVAEHGAAVKQLRDWCKANPDKGC